MLTHKRSKTAKRKALRLGWISVISFWIATFLMCFRHEVTLWASVGFAFIGVILMWLSADAEAGV